MVLVGADVAVLARGSEALAAGFISRDPANELAQTPASYEQNPDLDRLDHRDATDWIRPARCQAGR
jgi:hypothetical protein